MRRLLPMLLLGLLACGDGSTFDTFTLRARAPSGTEGAGPAIVPGAVDRIDLVIDPADNVRFEPMPLESFEDGEVTVRTSAAGEYVLSVQRGWIERNREDTDTSWILDVPLFIDGMAEPVPGNPTVRVFFVQFIEGLGEQPIGEGSGALVWPPAAGEVTTIQVLCTSGYETECQTPTP